MFPQKKTQSVLCFLLLIQDLSVRKFVGLLAAPHLTAVTLLWQHNSSVRMSVKAKKLFPKCSACSARSPTLLLVAQ